MTSRGEGGARSGIRGLWRRVLLARRGYTDLNRATHGAFGFNTVAKLLAWGGVCAIVLLLLHKVHQIQLELDPVGQGLQRLQQELQSANATVASDAQASENELEAVRSRALRLVSDLDDASKRQREGDAPMLAKAEQEARDLAAAATKERDAFLAVVAQRDLLAKSIGEYQQLLDRGKDVAARQMLGVADGGASAESALRGLSATADRGSAALDAAIAKLRLDELATQSQAIQNHLTDLQRQIDRLSAAIATSSTQLVAAPKAGATGDRKAVLGPKSRETPTPAGSGG